jgi:Holliday junction resolvase-like predicted endonuclease
VDIAKRRKIIRAASDYLFHVDEPGQRIRFDIVSVVFGEGERIDHLPDAFTREQAAAYS